MKKLFLSFCLSAFSFLSFSQVITFECNNEIIVVANDVLVEFVENSDSFSENDWKELYKLSEKTFVEENESLKQSAAGAGLTDND